MQLGGWDFPFWDSQTDLRIDKDFIEQEKSQFGGHLEMSRFYQSGQFIDFAGMREDWLNQSGWLSPSVDRESCGSLNVAGAVFKFTVAFEFTACLALTEAGDEQMHIEITVEGLKARALNLKDGRLFRQKTIASMAGYPYKIDLSRTQLIVEPRELSLKPALELLGVLAGTRV